MGESSLIGDAPLVALGALVSAACALVWILVARRLGRRALAPEHRAAGRALVLAFLAAASMMAITSIAGLAATAGIDLGVAALGAAWLHLLAALVVAGGVVAYLAYLITGDPRAPRVVAAVYAAILVALVGIVLSLDPTGVIANGWMIRFQFARAPPTANPLLAALVLAPAAAASLAYLAILPRTRDPTARWRIALVGGGFTLWLGAALGTRLVGGSEALLAGARATALLATVGLYFAYSPPAWAKRRGVRSLDDELPRAPDTAARDALVARVRELV